jgi:hypothetical protein
MLLLASWSFIAFIIIVWQSFIINKLRNNLHNAKNQALNELTIETISSHIMKNLDLFDGETDKNPNLRPSDYQKWKLRNKYRESTDPNICCKTCVYSKKHRKYTYKKCVLLGESSSIATDIRMRDVCDLYIKE